MGKISKKTILKNAFKWGYRNKESIEKVYKMGLIWDYEKQFLFEYFKIK